MWARLAAAGGASLRTLGRAALSRTRAAAALPVVPSAQRFVYPAVAVGVRHYAAEGQGTRGRRRGTGSTSRMPARDEDDGLDSDDETPSREEEEEWEKEESEAAAAQLAEFVEEVSVDECWELAGELEEDDIAQWLVALAFDHKILVLDPLYPSDSLQWEIYMRHAEDPKTNTLDALAKEYQMDRWLLGQVVRLREMERRTFQDPNYRDLFLELLPVTARAHTELFHVVTHPLDPTPITEYAPYLRAVYDLKEHHLGGDHPDYKLLDDEAYLKMMKAGKEDIRARNLAKADRDAAKAEEVRRYGKMPPDHQLRYPEYAPQQKPKGRPTVVVSDTSRNVDYQNRTVTVVKADGTRAPADELLKARTVSRNFPRFRAARPKYGGLPEAIPDIRQQIADLLKLQREHMKKEPSEWVKKVTTPEVKPKGPKPGTVPRNMTPKMFEKRNFADSLLRDPDFVDKVRTVARKLALGQIKVSMFVPEGEEDDDDDYSDGESGPVRPSFRPPPRDTADKSRAARDAFFAGGKDEGDDEGPQRGRRRF